MLPCSWKTGRKIKRILLDSQVGNRQAVKTETGLENYTARSCQWGGGESPMDERSNKIKGKERKKKTWGGTRKNQGGLDEKQHLYKNGGGIDA